MHDMSRCVINPEISQDGYTSLSVPTYRASTITFPDLQSYASRGDRWPDGYTYGLNGTPTTRALEARLTSLEGGTRTALVPSGQCAVTMVLLSLLDAGDKLLIPDNVYPPVRGFAMHYLKPRGIDFEVYDTQIGAGIADLIDDRTRLIWVESPGSTTMEVQDVPAIVKAAHARNVLVGCNNTWATPLLFKPLAHGADVSIEAITKYISGHSDLLMGSISTKDAAVHVRIKATMRTLGIGVSPDDCFLVLRGLETMGVRIAHSGRVALELAQLLIDSPVVKTVLHPGLPSCPGHDIWKRDFAGGSGVFSVVLDKAVQPDLSAALSAMEFFTIGSSWGGTQSLIAPMEISGDRTLSTWDPMTIVLRINVGLEDPRDLQADMKTLFARLEKSLA